MGDENNKNGDTRASVSPDASDVTAESVHQEQNQQDEAPHLLSIDEVARRTDLSKPTLRFYEQKGLVEPPARLPRKFRKYSSQDLERLERVKQFVICLASRSPRSRRRLNSIKNMRGWRNRRARSGMRRTTRRS